MYVQHCILLEVVCYQLCSYIFLKHCP